jgi:transcriptional antiterminator NusG
MQDTIPAETEKKETEKKLYAIKVRTASESTVAGVLANKGFDVLAPTYVEHRQYSDRVRKANKALFPGYIFVRMDAQKLLPVVSTPGVNYVVKTGRSVVPLAPEEESTIACLARIEAHREPFRSFVEGQRVRIADGPLAGQAGVLVRVGDRERVVLSVDSIFCSVIVDLKKTQLHLIH